MNKDTYLKTTYSLDKKFDSSAGVDNLWCISTDLMTDSIKLNYGINAIGDLITLFKDPKSDDANLASGTGVYHYENYEETNVDKIPVSLGYDGLLEYVTLASENYEKNRKNNLISYYNDVIFSNFTLGYFAASSGETKVSGDFISKDGDMTKSYYPASAYFIKAVHAPATLEAYVNIRGVLFRMNKVGYLTQDSGYGNYTFQYPAFLIEQYSGIKNSIICIEFTLDLSQKQSWNADMRFEIFNSADANSDDKLTSISYDQKWAYFNPVEVTEE